MKCSKCEIQAVNQVEGYTSQGGVTGAVKVALCQEHTEVLANIDDDSFDGCDELYEFCGLESVSEIVRIE